jgi:hypothetical protein
MASGFHDFLIKHTDGQAHPHQVSKTAAPKRARQASLPACCMDQSWCENSNTLFHCSTRNTSASLLFHLWNSWSRQLFHTLSDVTHTEATLACLLSAADSTAHGLLAIGYIFHRLYTIYK